MILYLLPPARQQGQRVWSDKKLNRKSRALAQRPIGLVFLQGNNKAVRNTIKNKRKYIHMLENNLNANTHTHAQSVSVCVLLINKRCVCVCVGAAKFTARPFKNFLKTKKKKRKKKLAQVARALFSFFSCALASQSPLYQSACCWAAAAAAAGGVNLS